MSGIRNASVARGHLNGPANTTAYTVPAEHVLLLKAVVLTNLGAVDANVQLLLSTSDALVQVKLLDEQLVAGHTRLFDTWQAMNATDVLVVVAGGSAIYYWVSGAVLPQLP